MIPRVWQPICYDSGSSIDRCTGHLSHRQHDAINLVLNIFLIITLHLCLCHHNIPASGDKGCGTAAHIAGSHKAVQKENVDNDWSHSRASKFSLLPSQSLKSVIFNHSAVPHWCATNVQQISYGSLEEGQGRKGVWRKGDWMM